MSKIEWLRDSDGVEGKTWNPVTGCTKISPGCEHCYAERMSKRLAGRFGYPAENPFSVTCHPDKLDKPLHWKKPRNIFVCSMSDLFHKDVPDAFIAEVCYTMATESRHTFQALTKRVERAATVLTELGPIWEKAAFYVRDFEHPRWPLPNVWLGTSCENQDTANERIPHLLRTPAAVRFLSLEPLLSGINLAPWLCDHCEGRHWDTSAGDACPICGGESISWLIVGGETGPGARPMDPDRARDIRDQCKAAGVPFFFKAMGGGQPTPKDLMIREFPNT